MGDDSLHVFVNHCIWLKKYEYVRICLQLGDVDIYLKLGAEDFMAYPEIPALLNEKWNVSTKAPFHESDQKADSLEPAVNLGK